MSMKLTVKVVEAVALVAGLVFVVMLFANEGGGEASPGAAIYANSCASCHGADGSGGLGPALAGEVSANFPDVADQITFVAEGAGIMPAFGDELSDEELRQVVEYTRSLEG
jgi:mono/diheme cytochrome c family protein